MDFTGIEKHVLRRWMRLNAGACMDPKTGEVNAAQLAENCAHAFNVGDVGGPLDDPDHWIWELALETREIEDRG